jgi:hypothetical protein
MICLADKERGQVLRSVLRFGGMIGRSQATIKAIETGKLALSEDLATLISVALGTDKEWLLKNGGVMFTLFTSRPTRIICR